MPISLTVTFEGVSKTRTAPDSWLPVLERFLAARNAERQAEGLDPLEDLPDYFVEILAQAAKSYKDGQEEADAGEVASLYKAADQTKRDQVDALLGRS